MGPPVRSVWVIAGVLSPRSQSCGRRYRGGDARVKRTLEAAFLLKADKKSQYKIKIKRIARASRCWRMKSKRMVAEQTPREILAAYCGCSERRRPKPASKSYQTCKSHFKDGTVPQRSKARYNTSFWFLLKLLAGDVDCNCFVWLVTEPGATLSQSEQSKLLYLCSLPGSLGIDLVCADTVRFLLKERERDNIILYLSQVGHLGATAASTGQVE